MLKNQKGFTLIGVLFLVVVFGIAHIGVSTYMSTIVKREKESALLFRGNQIKKAIESYCNSSKQSGSTSYPADFKALLRDPRYLSVKRHLRKLYRDPFSDDGKWHIILDASGKMKGIYSKSKDTPLKVANFPKEYAHFEKAKTHSDWRFVYDKK